MQLFIATFVALFGLLFLYYFAFTEKRDDDKNL